MEYVKRFGGYIADVPKVYLKRCGDDKTFVLDEITQASVTPNVNTVEINAGWSLFPVAVLQGQSTFEMQITSGKFESELFSFANNKNVWESDDDFEIPGTVIEEVNATDNSITLPHKAVAGSVQIDQLEEDTETGDGKFTTEVITGTDSVQRTKVTFEAAMAGKTVRVNYSYTAAVDYINVDNKASAICEAVLEFPVYDDGTNCALAAVMGHVYVKVFKARITQMPGMDGSYKSASTFQMTLSALDAKRADEAVYQIYYVRN